jgi:hypothetical protein
MPNVLLFADLLGVRACWLRGGRVAAESAFKDFRNLIAGALRGRTVSEVTAGLIETDAAAVICTDVRVALDIGKHLYQMAFNQTNSNRNRHYWLRGVIVPRISDLPLRKTSHFTAPLGHVELMLYESELFDAVAIEKSGVKGMRLLVDKTLLTQQVIDQYRIPVGHLSFIPFKNLRSSYYPPSLKGTYLDYLWMQSGEPRRDSRWNVRCLLVSELLLQIKKSFRRQLQHK